MDPLIEKILQDCDTEVRKWMLADSTVIEEVTTEGVKKYHKNWHTLKDPAMTALTWQLVRNQHTRTGFQT